LRRRGRTTADPNKARDIAAKEAEIQALADTNEEIFSLKNPNAKSSSFTSGSRNSKVVRVTQAISKGDSG